MSQPDPKDYETPFYEVWARNTTNDGRSHFSHDRDWGEEFSRQARTTDIREARRLLDKWSKHPMTAEVKVVWDLDRKSYTEACERADLERLKAKYPEQS